MPMESQPVLILRYCNNVILGKCKLCYESSGSFKKLWDIITVYCFIYTINVPNNVAHLIIAQYVQ